MANQCTFKGCLGKGRHVPELTFKGGTMSIDHVILCDKHKDTFGPDTVIDFVLRDPQIRRVMIQALKPYHIDFPKAQDCKLEWQTLPEIIIAPN